MKVRLFSLYLLSQNIKEKFLSLSPDVHPVVDNRIDHGVGHRQPVESQVDVLDEGLADDALVVVGVEEVGVVGEPAHAEDGHDDHEHLHDLKC